MQKMSCVRMNKLWMFFVFVAMGFSTHAQVYNVDNYYMVMKRSINKSPKGVNVDAINDFLSTIKVPIEVLEQRIEGHVFVNIYVKDKKVTQTTLMYGINRYADRSLLEAFMDVDPRWLGKDLSDSTQRVVMGIKIDYRFCTLQNIDRTSLYLFEKEDEDSSNAGIGIFLSAYNKYDKIFFFDSSSVRMYHENVSKEKQRKVVGQLATQKWWRSDFVNSMVMVDYDDDKEPNIIVTVDDSVHVFESNVLVFSDKGELKAIKQSDNMTVFQLESVCKKCSKTSVVTSMYVHKGGESEDVLWSSSFSSNPRLPIDTLMVKKNIQTTAEVTYLRTSPFKINEPFNRCSGSISEYETCILPKTWGNIYGEILQGNSLHVISEYVDSFNKKWYYVMVHRVDGCYLGWISDDEVFGI